MLITEDEAGRLKDTLGREEVENEGDVGAVFASESLTRSKLAFVASLRRPMPPANRCSSPATFSTTTPGRSNATGVPNVFEDEGAVEEDDAEDVDDDTEEELKGRIFGTGTVSFASSLLLTTSYCSCSF